MSLIANSKMRTLKRLPVINPRKVGMTSNHHAPYVQGYRRAIMAGIKRCKPVRGSKTPKPVSVRIEVCNSTS